MNLATANNYFEMQFSVRKSGGVLFHDNQVLMAFASGQRGGVSFSCLVVSGSDISAQGNRMEVAGEPQEMVNTAFWAPLVRVANNLFAETIHPKSDVRLLSLMSVGSLMNCTMGNQAIHCYRIVGQPSRLVDSGNVSLLCARDELPPLPSGETRTVTGKVLSEEGFPVMTENIADADVWMEQNPSLYTKTNNKGEFTLEGLPTTSLTICAKKTIWWYELNGSENVPTGQESVEVEIWVD